MTNTNNIITIKSFWSSGGSAVNDLLLEFDNITGFRQQEITLIETIDGIMDLDYRFNKNRANILTGMQISKFAKLVDHISQHGQYSWPYDSEKLFRGYFKQRSYEFIKNISLKEVDAYLEFIYHIYADKDFQNKYRKTPYKKYKRAKKRAKLFPWLFKCNPPSHYYPREKYFLPSDSLTFNKELGRYLNDLFQYLLNKHSSSVVLDQMLNIDTFLQYKNTINDLKYIIVDRDPRDIYILNREKLQSLVIPSNVDDFIIWFESTRAALTPEVKSLCLHMNFEDLIYNYDEQIQKVMNYLEINDETHVRPKKFLNPQTSIKNTQLFNRTNKYSEDIKRIEKLLPQYLYNFPYAINTELKNIF